MIIGLTGGIASGKTSVTTYLKQLNIPVVDADVIAREVVEPGSKGLSEIVKHFGHNILSKDCLNRKALREIIFSDDSKRLLLNSILHPIIHDEILKRLHALKNEGHAIIIFDAPLLLENNLQEMVDELWVVAASETNQIKRVMQRDDITKEEAKVIISKQMPLSEKIRHADVVIRNDDTISSLYEQINQLLKDHQ